MGRCPKTYLVLGLRSILPLTFLGTLQELLAWSSIFRSEHTFANYLNHARVGCALANQRCNIFDIPFCKRVRLSVAKKGGFRKRALDVVRDMLTLLVSEPQWLLTAMWCLTTHIVLLVPSERLPITIGVGSVHMARAMLRFVSTQILRS